MLLFFSGTNQIPEWVAEETELFKTQLDLDGNGQLQGNELFEWVRPNYKSTAKFEVRNSYKFFCLSAGLFYQQQYLSYVSNMKYAI